MNNFLVKHPSISFLYGILLILAGWAIAIVIGMILLEKPMVIQSYVVQNGVTIRNPEDTPENQQARLVLALAILGACAFAATVAGFFLSKGIGYEFRSVYYFLTAGFAGFLIVSGWNAIAKGRLGKKRL